MDVIRQHAGRVLRVAQRQIEVDDGIEGASDGKPPSKQGEVIAMLRRPEGATVDEVGAHSRAEAPPRRCGPGSHRTPRWREGNSNCRSRLGKGPFRIRFFGLLACGSVGPEGVAWADRDFGSAHPLACLFLPVA